MNLYPGLEGLISAISTICKPEQAPIDPTFTGKVKGLSKKLGLFASGVSLERGHVSYAGRCSGGIVLIPEPGNP